MIEYRTGMLNGMATSQIAVRLDNALLESVDELVASGVMESRADVVRQAITQLLERRQQEHIDQLMLAGYRTTPSTPAEDAAAEAALRAAIAEEQW